MPDFFIIFYRAETNRYEAVNGPNPDKTFTGVDGIDANGLAARQQHVSGKYVAFPIAGAGFAYLQTNVGVANADVLYTADNRGTGGNSIRIRYVVAGNNTALSVSVSTNDITVNLATNGTGVPTSTAAQIVTAVNANGPASALVTAVAAPNGDGSGVPVALAFTNLAKGDWGAAVATESDLVEAVQSSVVSF